MKKEILRVYTDTSVFGGVFDEEFKTPSARFFESARQGAFHLVISDIVRREIAGAPASVRNLFQRVLQDAEIVDVTPDSLKLREAYIAAQVVSPEQSDDALHVALPRSTVAP